MNEHTEKLEKLAEFLESRGVRKYLNVNDCGYSQIERDIVALFPIEDHTEGFFIGQFEVFYNHLQMNFEEARNKAYENTLKYFDLPQYKHILEQFIKNYKE